MHYRVRLSWATDILTNKLSCYSHPVPDHPRALRSDTKTDNLPQRLFGVCWNLPRILQGIRRIKHQLASDGTARGPALSSQRCGYPSSDGADSLQAELLQQTMRC